MKEVKRDIARLVSVKNNDEHNKAVLRLQNKFEAKLNQAKEEAVRGFEEKWYVDCIKSWERLEVKELRS